MDTAHGTKPYIPTAQRPIDSTMALKVAKLAKAYGFRGRQRTYRKGDFTLIISKEGSWRLLAPTYHMGYGPIDFAEAAETYGIQRETPQGEEAA